MPGLGPSKPTIFVPSLPIEVDDRYPLVDRVLGCGTHSL